MAWMYVSTSLRVICFDKHTPFFLSTFYCVSSTSNLSLLNQLVSSKFRQSFFCNTKQIMANKVEHETSLKSQLKTKQICRFCCSSTDSLTNIYSPENRIKSKAPLPLQVISIISIEVSFVKSKI